jgi:hypothetical protein
MFERFKVDRRFAEILGGIALLVVAFSIGDFEFAWLPASLGIFLLWRQFNQNNTSAMPSQRSGSRWRREVERDTDGVDLIEGPSGTQIYAHALAAVRRAGLDAERTPVLPVDIGIIAYHDGQPPELYRGRPVADDLNSLQPFIQLRLATRATGKLRFEILDADGQAVFIHEDFHSLQAGLNLVSPPSRLPIHDGHAMHRQWRLRVSADDIVIADHSFGWVESAEKVIRRHVRVDGELSPEMRQLLDEPPQERLSLDELLAEQEAPPAQQMRR